LALRLIEVTIPLDDRERLTARMVDVPIVTVWTTETVEGHALVRALLDAKEVEALSDVLVRDFGHLEAFRLVSLAVESTLPAVAAPEKTEPSPNDAKKSASRLSRDELYEDISEATRLTPAYVATVVLSTVVAIVGLIRGDVAVLIGAMVIAPLLGPNMCLALAATLGDGKLARRSLKANGVGVAIAAALAIAVGLFVDVDPAADVIAGRTNAGIGDIILALAAGAAGTLAFTSGVSAVLVGVMVAVALLPPLAVSGLLLASGQGTPALGALALLLTNVTCINLAAMATFYVQRVRPRTWWEGEHAKRATRVALGVWLGMLALLLSLILIG